MFELFLAFTLSFFPSTQDSVQPTTSTLTTTVEESTPQSSAHLYGTPVAVGQGDTIYLDGNKKCTVGYVTETFAVTAAHCGKTYSHVTDTQGRSIGWAIDSGYLYENEAASNSTGDWLVIALRPTVVTTGNIYSGDNFVSPHDIQVGDLACLHGATTQRVACTTIDEINDTEVRASYNITQAGDSGAGWYIPNKGMLAIHHGSSGDTSIGSLLNDAARYYIQ